MKSRTVVATLFVGAVLTLGAGSVHAQAAGCADFLVQHEAQMFFESWRAEHPNEPDPYALDEDGDGRACEGLPTDADPGTIAPSAATVRPVEGASDVRLIALISFAVLFSVLIFAVGRLLRTHGIVFLELVFGRDGRVAHATNALLNIGYYLLSLSLLFLNAGDLSRVANSAEAIQMVALRLGRSVLVVAVIHFLNMLIFTSFFRRTAIRDAEHEWKRETASMAAGI